MRRHITRTSFMLICAWLLACSLSVAGQSSKYGVKVLASNPESLATAKTYVWTTSQPSPLKDVDAQIVAAVDRELRALGLTKVASGRADLDVTYASVRRTDVDVKSKPSASGTSREYAVGSLLVDVRGYSDHESRYRVRTDTPIDTDSGKLEAAINQAVSEMFKKYPTRP